MSSGATCGTGRPLRVLIVEDNVADAELCLRILRRAGLLAEADIVQTADRFIQLIERSVYDIVLADYAIPGWPGMEALAVLQQRGLDVPFILVTGTAGEETAVDCIKQGAADYVLKDRLARLPVAVCRALKERIARAERERALEALKKSEQDYRTLFESANDALLIFEPEGETILDANQKACETYGVSKEKLLGVSLKAFTKDVPRGEAQLRDLLKEGRYENFETTHFRADGTPVEMLVSSTAIEYRGQKAVLSINRDITERKRAEEELAQRAAELARSNADLEQFAYAASHDLKEPLRMVASYTNLLARRYKGKLDDKADQYIHYAVEGAARMHALIEGLLAYSRIGTRGSSFRPTTCRAAINGALSNLVMAIRKSEAIVTVDPLPVVIADEVQLTQLFQNLIGNAIKFRGPNAPRINIFARQNGDECVFAVQDNGIGIGREHRDRAFVLFQRLHGRARYSGTGMGLAICKKIAERHGGRIWVESEPGKGSTFYFTLTRQKPVVSGEKDRHAEVAVQSA